MKTGRPIEYKEEYCQMVDEYLLSKQDEYSENGKQKVRLPTIEGFALFLGVALSTVYEWANKYPNFSESLCVIKNLQKERLINKGLSGDYNSTIAKLILSSNHGMREKSDITSDDKPIKGNTIVVRDFSKVDYEDEEEDQG